MNEYLEGGRDTIYKQDNCVFRPATAWSSHVHDFLKYLHSQGFHKVPYPYEIDKYGFEKLSYVEGTVYNDLLPDEVKSDETLISVCKLIKQFHDMGEGYIKTLTGRETWMLPARTPVETMCHGVCC